MPNTLEARGMTAMFRAGLSRPVTLALEDGLLGAGSSFFDFGCGHGTDVAALRSMKIDASGWDPVHAPVAPKAAADVVNLGYVANVIEHPAEREQVLREAWELSRRLLVVAARLDWDIKTSQAVPFNDGVITARGTFQKFFTQDELQRWIQETLAVEADAAGPGVFYVFRRPEDREGHLARVVRRTRHALAVPLPALAFEHNREVLEPLQRFLCERGRPPFPGELAEESLLVQRLGSLARAVKILARVADVRIWEQVAIARQRDLLVYLALGAFRRKPKFNVLPGDLRFDIKHFFGSYEAATRLGRELLFGAGQQAAISEECAKAPVGKVTPEALYVHVSSVGELPVLLRVYEGCARTLLGEVIGATVVKLRRDKPRVSYLCYPDFDHDPHPALKETFVADLRALRTHHRNYVDSENPPILHRKECFVSEGYPLRDAFAALTQAEIEAGLLADAADIGTRRVWQERLASQGFIVRGHELVKVHPTPPV
jgi:DNA phosphorothioation-associated putative methyltransferase